MFIVGNCSDKAEQTYYIVEIDVHLLVIEARWCGSIIGHIKLRDFAIANCRSRSPEMVGKKNFCVIRRRSYSPLHLHRPFMDKRLLSLQHDSRVDPFKTVFIKEIEQLNHNKQIMLSLMMRTIFDCLHY